MLSNRYSFLGSLERIRKIKDEQCIDSENLCDSQNNRDYPSTDILIPVEGISRESPGVIILDCI